MKKLLLLFTAFLAVFSAFADDVKVVWTSASDWTAVGNSTYTYTQDGYTVKLDKGAGSTKPAINATANDARVYAKGTVTVSSTSNTIKKLVFAVSKKGKCRLTDITANTGEAVADSTTWTVTWTGSASEVVLTVGEKATLGTEGKDMGGQFDFDNITVTGEAGGSGEVTPEPTDDAATLFSEKFSSDLGDFTQECKTDGLTFDIWSHSSKFSCALGSGYVSGTRYEAESWLISPVIDLTKATDCTLSFDNAGNYFGETFASATGMKVRVEGGEWVTLDYSNTATGTAYNFVTATADLSEYDGKKIQFAFVYTSTATTAGTWEIKNVLVKGITDEAPEIVASPAITPAAGTYNDKVTVTISAEEGTSIYYTTDGSEPTTENGTLYTAPFELTASAKVRAIAVNANGTVSEETIAAYTIKTAPAVADNQVLFYFTGNKWNLPVSSSSESLALTSPITEGNVSLAFTDGSTSTRMWNDANNGLQLRVYKGATLTLSTTDDTNITAVEFNTSKINLTAGTGTLDGGSWTGDATKSVTFTATNGTNINYLIVTLDKVSGINGVAADGANTVKVVYSLDGRKLQQPAKGVNIINGKKVLVK